MNKLFIFIKDDTEQHTMIKFTHTPEKEISNFFKVILCMH